MELSVHSGRREERVPLDALIELRTEEGGEALEADGVDLSPGGLSMRAAFVPPVGARLSCQFRCSPDGERVRAEGEVVWGQWKGPHDGSFGMRFLALDTKSATAIRRYIEPEPERVPTGPVNMRIDGLDAPIEADVRAADEGSVVLEQELTFLRLGRGVSIDVPGRGKKRGRIGSVELRHSPLDVPTLVFGILLDGETASDGAWRAAKRAEAVRSVHAREAVVGAKQVHAPASPEMLNAVSAEGAEQPECVQVQAEVVARQADAPAEADVPAQADVPAASTAHLDAQLAERAESPEPAHQAHAREAAEGDVPEEVALVGPPKVLQLERALPALRELVTQWLSKLAPKVREQWARLVALSAGWKAAALVPLVWLREFSAAQVARVRAFRKVRKTQRRRATAPAPRVAGSAQAGRAEAQRRAKPRNQRFAALTLAAVGVGLGVYALAPRSGADRIRVATVLGSEEPESLAVAEPAPAPVEEAPAPPAAQAEPEKEVAESAAPTERDSLSFGDAEVPRGRTFTLRLSGPAESLEGERREDGFTVRIPRRLALDRASPIATSHRAVARAMILNRGEYAELTVDFVPGLKPKYQVLAKDALLEITLERL